MLKTIEQHADEYLHDPRWKRVNGLCKIAQFEKAIILSNQIIDSYPDHVRQRASEEDIVFKPDYIPAGFTKPWN